MTQAVSPLQQAIHQFQTILEPVLAIPELRRWLRAIETYKGWLSLGAMVLLLTLWQWQLMLAIGIGLAVMVVLYLGLQGQWERPIARGQRWCANNRSLVLALATGSAIGLGLYGALNLWQELHGSWLAIALIIQGAGVLSLVAVLGWRWVDRLSASDPVARTTAWVDRAFTDLSDVDPLRRLIAVRRLTRWMLQRLSSSSFSAPATGLSSHELADCFRLMLNRETEGMVCRALMESLQQLGTLPSGQQPSSSQPHRQLTASQSPLWAGVRSTRTPAPDPAVTPSLDINQSLNAQ